MKNANATQVSRVKVPKLTYASSKKPLWLKDQGQLQGDLSSSPIILPPIPPKMPGDTPRVGHGQHGKGSLPNKNVTTPGKQGRHSDMKYVTPRSNRQAVMGYNVIKELDVTQTIRKKIEQYRKWHDAQHDEPQSTRRKTTVETTTLQRGGDNELMANMLPVYGHNTLGEVESPQAESVMPMPNNLPKRSLRDVEPTDIDANVLRVEATAQRTSRGSTASVPTDLVHMRPSARTWRTWRGVNDSYCYNDVQEYIRDNELMDDEKERTIRRWMLEVFNAVHIDGDFVRYDVDPSSSFP